LCARVLAAPDPADAAWEAWQLVNDDRTADRLAGLLPFPHDEPIAVLGWPDLAGAALAERPDLDAVAIRRRTGNDHRRARPARREASTPIVDAGEAVPRDPSHLLVEALAAGPQRAVVAAGAGDLLDALAATRTAGWLVAGVGRVLPERLFAAVESELGRGGGEHTPVGILDVTPLAPVARPPRLHAPPPPPPRLDSPVAPPP